MDRGTYHTQAHEQQQPCIAFFPAHLSSGCQT
jgi:hypothetical protein